MEKSKRERKTFMIEDILGLNGKEGGEKELPAWIYCTRYSDRPTAGEINTAFEEKKPLARAKMPPFVGPLRRPN